MKDPRAVIDWWLILCNGLWIAGAAVVLSSWSYHRWVAAASGHASRREVFCRASWLISSGVGALLLCFGFMTLARAWSAAVWALLTAIAAVRVWRGVHKVQWNQ